MSNHASWNVCSAEPYSPLCYAAAKIDIADYCNWKCNSWCSEVQAMQKSYIISVIWPLMWNCSWPSWDPCQPSHILVLLHLLTSLKLLIRYSYKCEWLKVFSLSHYNLHVNWIHSSVTFIHSYLIDFSLKGDNRSLLLKCTESCPKYFWCSLYFMFSLPLGQIAASFSTLNSYP